MLASCAPKKSTEILWDVWGVPHIFSESTEGPFCAFGWAQKSSRLLLKDEKITFDECLENKMSTRVEMADRLPSDLIPAVRELGGESLKEAADLLEVWGRKTDAQSRGAVLFNARVTKEDIEANLENPESFKTGQVAGESAKSN